jgi:hypothetical protein
MSRQFTEEERQRAGLSTLLRAPEGYYQRIGAKGAKVRKLQNLANGRRRLAELLARGRELEREP